MFSHGTKCLISYWGFWLKLQMTICKCIYTNVLITSFKTIKRSFLFEFPLRVRLNNIHLNQEKFKSDRNGSNNTTQQYSHYKHISNLQTYLNIDLKSKTEDTTLMTPLCTCSLTPLNGCFFYLLCEYTLCLYIFLPD